MVAQGHNQGLETLQGRRDKILRQLTEVDRQIAKLANDIAHLQERLTRDVPEQRQVA
jgi:hypothetical protein